MKITTDINSYNTYTRHQQPDFTANIKQYRRAVRYLKKERIKGSASVFANQMKWLKRAIEFKMPIKDVKKRITGPANWRFTNSDRASNLYLYGIKSLNPDKLEGIQYGIDVFKDLSMREIIFLAYRTVNLAVKRGCANMCEHCFHDAKPARKTELSELPFEDFKKITDGFKTIQERINKTLRYEGESSFIGSSANNFHHGFAANLTGFFYDSDGMDVIAKDINGKEYDFIDLTELFHKATGKKVLFDTAGWNPKNQRLQQRAEKYAQYFSQPDIGKKVEQINLSINTFNPLYTKSYKLGYRPGMENDLTNPDIQKGKLLYDAYIERIANMLATFGLSKETNFILTYSTRYEKNMDGMYLSDLKQILNDAEKKCDEILRKEYSENEYSKNIQKIRKLIKYNFEKESCQNYVQSRCKYSGRYEELYNSRNPEHNMHQKLYEYTDVQKINNMSLKEYQNFLKCYEAVIDTNGELYYQMYDSSARPMGKRLKLSTAGKKTPEIQNIETRE